MANKIDKKFEISADTCCDHRKSYLEEHGVHYIVMKRILNGKEIAEIFDTDEDFDNFYDEIKAGAMPSTTQLNPFELKAYFEDILGKTKGDLVHVSLSSGLSTTCANAKSAAAEINKALEAKKDARRVYVMDSLMGTLGIAHLIDKFIEFRDAGMDTEAAFDKVMHVRDHQQGWVVMTDLFHLKRGGRISGAAALIGTALKLRPIIHLSAKGKLASENKMSGNAKAIKYILSKMEKYGEKFNKDFATSTIWMVRSSKNELYDQLKDAVLAKYPNVKVNYGIVGPIIGSHLGCGAAAIMWEGAPRLDI